MARFGSMRIRGMIGVAYSNSALTAISYSYSVWFQSMLYSFDVNLTLVCDVRYCFAPGNVSFLGAAAGPTRCQ